MSASLMETKGRLGSQASVDGFDENVTLTCRPPREEVRRGKARPQRERFDSRRAEQVSAQRKALRKALAKETNRVHSRVCS